MKKRLWSLLLALCVLAGMLAFPVSAGAITCRDSGCANIPKLTQRQMADMMAENPSTMPASVYVETPNVAPPFAPGKLTDAVLQKTVNRLNALRTIAGLPQVTLDSALNQQAQYGAVIQAANGDLSHTPDRPEGMDDAFYNEAYAASSSSNLYAGLALTATPDGFMDDAGVSTLGHRRWQLNPYLGKVGFGYAESDTRYRRYTAEKVFDRSGAPGDFDFIAWPASGNFPATYANYKTAWSVSLNPAKFTRPASASELTVTLTRESDGKSWVFDGSTSSAVSYTEQFFRYDTGGYGINNCIMFHPDGIDLYDGTYTVRIDGIRDTAGNSVDFAYQVHFFDLANPYTPPEITAQPKSVQVVGAGTATFKVAATGSNLTYQWQYKNSSGVWKNCSSATEGYNTDTLKVQGVSGATNRNGYQYRCVVTGGGETRTSSAATLTVFAIKTQPADQQIVGGEQAVFKVAATGKNLTYQWQYSINGSTWANCTAKTEGYNTNTLKVQGAPGRNGYRYRCRITSGSDSLLTGSARLSIFAIQTQPAAVTAAAGSTATFKVVATGSGLTYQWQYKNSSGVWKNCTSATKGYNTNTLRVAAEPLRSGYQYRCKITSGGKTLTSAAARLTVKPIVITQQPESVTTAAGNSAVFHVTAEGKNLTYRWQYMTPTGRWKACTDKTVGYNTDTLRVSAAALRNGYQYCCIITSGSSQVVSAFVTLTVK